jgi:phospholipid/cholesterol/gamma-HCH transport system permease protein
MLSAVEYVGKAALGASRAWLDYFSLALKIFRKIFQRKSYSNTAVTVLINQIYFTAIQILPLFLTVATIIGFLLIGIFVQILQEMGLAEYLGRIIMGFVVTELAPFLTVLLLALRSSSAMNAEIATMKVNKELHTLEVFHIDIISYLFLPRVISGVVSVVLLSGIFSIVVLATGFVCSNLIFNMSLDAYANLLLNSAEISDILILLIKCSTFGFFITLIPIRSGLNATDDLTSIPVAVLNGMVKVFIAIIVIEVLTLTARSI